MQPCIPCHTKPRHQAPVRQLWPSVSLPPPCRQISPSEIIHMCTQEGPMETADCSLWNNGHFLTSVNSSLALTVFISPGLGFKKPKVKILLKCHHDTCTTQKSNLIAHLRCELLTASKGAPKVILWPKAVITGDGIDTLMKEGVQEYKVSL